jgi:hypothetical protein
VLHTADSENFSSHIFTLVNSLSRNLSNSSTSILASPFLTLVLPFQCYPEVYTDFIQQLYYSLMKSNLDIYFSNHIFVLSTGFSSYHHHPSLVLILLICNHFA